jgi:hypothetical protein
MKARTILFIAALLVVLACVAPPAWFQARSIYSTWLEARQRHADAERFARIRAFNARPPVPLVDRPADRATYPRESFAVSFVDENGFGVDTGKGTVTQDRISDPDTTVAMRLSPAELDTLYDDAIRDRLFEMPQPRPLPWIYFGSHWSGVLTLGAGSARHSLQWDLWTWNEPWSDDHKRLNSYVRKLARMAKKSPAYRVLPRPRGMYID